MHIPSSQLHRNAPFPTAWKLRRTTLLATAALLFPLSSFAGRAYVTNEDGDTVTVVDTNTTEVVATLNVGKRPRGIKLSADGKSLFVAVSGLPKCPPTVPDEECAKLKRDFSADGVAVIDTATLKLERLLKAGSDPEQFDLSRDGRHLFISNEDSATVSVVDAASGAVQGSIAVGKEPEGVRVSPDGKWVSVTSETGNAIFLIDASTRKPVKSISVGKRPRDVAYSKDQKTVYITGEFDGSIYTASIPDGQSATRLLQLRTEARPMGIVLDAAHNRLFVSTGRGGTVAVIDLNGSPRLVTEIKVGTRPWGIALSADGKRLYTANGSSNDMAIIDTNTLQVVKTVAVGKSPWGVAVSP
jgi:PQQ-dependent catabolism-associated beta-propeller protein